MYFFLMDRLTVRCKISGCSANKMLSASKVRGLTKGGKTEIGINLEGTKDNRDAGVPNGIVPPKRDPGNGLPGGISESFKSGRPGLMAITKAVIANAMTNAPTVSLNNKSGVICDGILFEESEVLSSSPLLVPKVAHDKVVMYKVSIYFEHWSLKSPVDVPQNS